MTNRGQRQLLALLAFGALVAGLGVVGGTARPASATAEAGGLQSLPPQLRAWYADAGVPSGPSPYANFKPKSGPPWTIGYASTFSGNTWRASALDEIRKQFAKYKKAGLVDKLIVTENQFNVAQTVQQIKQLRDKGADAILTIAPSATGINTAIDDSFKAGVPVVTFTSPVTTTKAINTGANYTAAGKMQARLLAQQLNGKGNVVYVAGIPGFTASEMIKKGSLDYYKSQPGIKIVAEINGIWTNPIAKTELLKTLATNPTTIDAVHNQSGMAAGIFEALQQSGRKNVKITVADDVAGGVYWQQNPAMANTGVSTFPARSEARIAFDTIIRTLEGQGPKVASIIRLPSQISFAKLPTFIPSGATTASGDWFETVPESYFATTLPKYFARPANPIAYKKG